jgi:hypothetical protein
VTLTATLLTPNQPRPDGRLAVQVKLDTHAVDLDRYQLDTLATLRDAQGQEIQAIGLESPACPTGETPAVLLVIAQFEERLGREQTADAANRFLQLLRAAIEADKSPLMVLSGRSPTMTVSQPQPLYA